MARLAAVARRRARPAVVAALLAAPVCVVAPPPAGAATPWLRPVPGPVVRPFDYDPARSFLAGAHRGADLGASPGTRVLAACGGRVLHAGTVAALGRVVTIRCGAHRVTYLPLATVRVRAGSEVARGAVIGTVGAGHGGLHLGARRAGDRFAYEDPLALVGHHVPPPVSAAPRAPARRPPARPFGIRPRTNSPDVVRPGARSPVPGLVRPGARSSVPGLVRPRARSPVPGLMRPRARAPVSPLMRPGAPLPGPLVGRPRVPDVVRPDVPRPFIARAPSARGTAPLIVWAGLALLLTGAIGSCTVAVRRRRAVAAGTPVRVTA